MNLTSEHVHWLGGAVFVSVTLVLLAREIRLLRGRWISYVLPALLVAYGLESFVDPWVHGAAAPSDYGAETAQHAVQGLVALTIGIVEWLRSAGRLRGTIAALTLPLGLAAVGAVFFFHAQHEAGAPMLVLLVQHRIFGVTLWVTAATKVLVDLLPRTTQRLSAAWLIGLLLFGIELLLYTEGGPHAGH